MIPVIVPCPFSMLAQITTSTEIVMPLTTAFISEVKGRSDKGQTQDGRFSCKMICTEVHRELCIPV